MTHRYSLKPILPEEKPWQEVKFRGAVVVLIAIAGAFVMLVASFFTQ